jgi:flagellum-specific ATP synthase
MKLKQLLSVYRSAEDLISVGAYQKGTNPKLDKVVQMNEKINDFLTQDTDDQINYEDVVNELIQLGNM